MAKTNKEQYNLLMSELATAIKSLTNSTGKLTLEQIVTKAKQITPAPTLSGNATVNQVLKDATFYNTDPNTKLTGTIETFTPSEVTSNGTLQTSGKYVNADIVVKVPSPTGTLDITTNGTKDVTNYASVNVNVPLPTLNAPTISLSNSTVTITNPVTNGSFVSGYDVYKNGTLLTSITLATVDLSTLITDSGTYTITVKAKGTNFNESPHSNEVNYTVTPAGGYTLTIVQEQSGGNLKVTKFDGTQEWVSETVSNVVSIDDVSYNGDYGKPYYLSPDISIPFTLTEDITITIYSEPCFVEGTLITMANGTYKKVEDIEYGDEVLCYDFNEGKQDTAIIDWMIPKQTVTEYWKITLSDGTVLKLVGPKDGPSKNKSHRLYNVTKQSFMYPQDFEKDDLTLKENGDLVKVVSCEKIFETVNFYNISSKDHINVYAEGVLTSNRLSNRFEIKDNKYTDRQLMTDEEIKAYKEHMERLKK